jgi:hypothetical protein
MRSLAFAALIGVGLSTTAFAMPLVHQGGMSHELPFAERARIVCEENGQCYRPEGRHPVARWIYGDGAFYGPYQGPGYYGLPGRRYKWSFFSPWNW